MLVSDKRLGRFGFRYDPELASDVEQAQTEGDPVAIAAALAAQRRAAEAIAATITAPPGTVPARPAATTLIEQQLDAQRVTIEQAQLVREANAQAVQAQQAAIAVTSTTSPGGAVSIGDAAKLAGVSPALLAASPALTAAYAAIDAVKANNQARAMGSSAAGQALAENALRISNKARDLAQAAKGIGGTDEQALAGLADQTAGEEQDFSTQFLASLQAGLDYLIDEAQPYYTAIKDNTGLLLGIAATLGGVGYWYLKKKGKL